MSSNGILIHAFGNEGIDYYYLANCAARLARFKLGIPVAIVTDKPEKVEADYVIEASSEIQQERTLRGLKYNYKNDTRVHSYNLSPFDKTLLIDSDFLIMNPGHRTWFQTDYDLISPTFYSIPGNEPELRYIYNGIPQAWATVIYFRKSTYAEKVFHYWKMAQDNWEFYRQMLNTHGNYRNDYSLSLALHTVNGYTNKYSNWFYINTIPTAQDIIDINFDTCEVVVGKNGTKIVTLKAENVHIMDKVRLCEIFKEKLVTPPSLKTITKRITCA